MDKNKKTNWLNIILNSKFQNAVQFKTLIEVSMVSKLAREKLNPLVFKTVVFFLKNIQFESNVLSVAIEEQFKNSQISFNFFATEADELEQQIEFDYQVLKEKHGVSVQDSFKEYEIALNSIKKFAKRFYFRHAKNAGYYLYPLINGFKNLTELSISSCDIPLTAFADIGKIFPNLNILYLSEVNLAKSPADAIASTDISFPPNLKSLTISNNQVGTTDLLMDPYEHLFNRSADSYSYIRFILPKHSLPLLKHLKYTPSGSSLDIEENLGLEEFLDANPQLECLDVRFYNLKMDSSLNSVKFLSIDDKICFNSMFNVSNLNSINTLNFAFDTFENTINFRKLCNICPNLIDLQLDCNGSYNLQYFIDNFLTPALPNLTKLKTLKISVILNNRNPRILDFTKFSQIRKLEMYSCGSILNIKFDSCKNLKQANFICPRDKITDEFMNNLNSYEGWTFENRGYAVFGNKI